MLNKKKKRFLFPPRKTSPRWSLDFLLEHTTGRHTALYTYPQFIPIKPNSKRNSIPTISNLQYKIFHFWQDFNPKLPNGARFNTASKIKFVYFFFSLFPQHYASHLTVRHTSTYASASASAVYTVTPTIINIINIINIFL